MTSEWTFICGLCERLSMGLDEPAQKAAIRFLNKLLHETGVLSERTTLNGGFINYPPNQDGHRILQLSCDCDPSRHDYSWYNELAEATEKMLESSLHKVNLEVQF